jgi:hypothetical protein
LVSRLEILLLLLKATSLAQLLRRLRPDESP